MAEETTQKMENIILELNKTGLSYLVASNPSLKRISSHSSRLFQKSRKTSHRRTKNRSRQPKNQSDSRNHLQ